MGVCICEHTEEQHSQENLQCLKCKCPKLRRPFHGFETSFVIGAYTIQPWHDGSFWLSRTFDGEGMQVRAHTLEALFHKFYQENF